MMEERRVSGLTLVWMVRLTEEQSLAARLAWGVWVSRYEYSQSDEDGSWWGRAFQWTLCDGRRVEAPAGGGRWVEIRQRGWNPPRGSQLTRQWARLPRRSATRVAAMADRMLAECLGRVKKV